MICRICRSEGRKSSIRFTTEIITSEFTDNFYDEDGNLHIHDPNITETTYTCSNGHVWTEREVDDCAVCQ